MRAVFGERHPLTSTSGFSEADQDRLVAGDAVNVGINRRVDRRPAREEVVSRAVRQ